MQPSSHTWGVHGTASRVPPAVAVPVRCWPGHWRGGARGAQRAPAQHWLSRPLAMRGWRCAASTHPPADQRRAWPPPAALPRPPQRAAWTAQPAGPPSAASCAHHQKRRQAERVCQACSSCTGARARACAGAIRALISQTYMPGSKARMLPGVHVHCVGARGPGPQRAQAFGVRRREEETRRLALTVNRPPHHAVTCTHG